MPLSLFTHPLHPLFYPTSIAIIGASKDPTKRGFRSIQKLIEDGFDGQIYPVNPKENCILGKPVYPSLMAIDAPVDLVLICTPAATVPNLMLQCGAKGVKGAVVLAGGFAESGSEGLALQQQMVAAAQEHGVRIIGPNTSGIFNTHAKSNIVGFSNLQAGGIGLLSQSGNMALALVTEAQGNGHLGLSTYVGIGNEADIQFHEYLAYMHSDVHTQVVIAYIEGMKDGQKFIETLKQITPDKPVVIYKSGRTSAGCSAAQSHTGALAGDYAVSAGVFKQAGAILARKSDEILPLAEALSLLKPMASRRVAVLADGGGHATIAADTLTEHGLILAPLTPATQRALAALLPPSAALHNPIDVAGGTDSNPAIFAACARILLADPHVDGLLISGLYGGYGVRFSSSLSAIEMQTSAQIAAMHHEFCKPVVVHSLYAHLCQQARPQPLSAIRQLGIPVHSSLELSVRCLQALAEYAEVRAQSRCAVAAPHNAVQAVTPPRRSPYFEQLLVTCRQQKRTVVLEHEARFALADAGIAMRAPAILSTTADEAEQAFATLGRVPVAMKIVAPAILHKTEANGVKLNLLDTTEVRHAFGEIVANGQRYMAQKSTTQQTAKPVDLRGVLVTPMAPKGGIEVIIGVVRDPNYGSVLMFGLGGVLVEVLKDVVFRRLPLTPSDARAMLAEIQAAAIFEGIRGAMPTDKAALVRLMVKISDFCGAFPEIAELDLNPVMAYADGATILDVRIVLESGAV